MDELHLWLPFDKSTISQGFGANDTSLYASLGLKGHPGIDFVVPYGTPIPNCFPGALCTQVISRADPDLMDFEAVNTIVDLPDNVSYEIQYGHCSTESAQVGDTYQVGDVIGTVGNTGPVFVGQHEVTEAEKEAGSKAGSHLHFQVRALVKVPEAESLAKGNVQRLNNGSGLLVLNGYVYEVPTWNNGYNGCVDPMPFLNGILASAQAQVKALQAQVTTFPDKPTPSDLQALIVALEAFLGISN